MVQNQLVEYISSQLKAGVSRDSIKASLVGAGWQAADVDDTMKQVEGSMNVAKPAAGPTPSVSAGAGMGMGAGMAAGAAAASSGMAKPADPQSIRVSDLISATDFTASPSSAAASPSTPASMGPVFSPKPVMMGGSMGGPSAVGPAPMKATDVKPAALPQDKATKAMFTSSAKPATSGGGAGANFSAGAAMGGMEYPPKTHSSHGAMIIEIVLGIIVIVVGALAAYFYAQDSSLAGKVSSLTSQSATLTSQMNTLEESMNASSSALAAQIASTTAANQELMTDLAFYVAPPGAAATSSATIDGMVSGGGKASYAITDQYGAKVYVTNSKSAVVMAALTPLEASSTPGTFSGTYVPGADTITLTAVNGTAVQ